jgi:hypothetical protein
MKTPFDLSAPASCRVEGRWPVGKSRGTWVALHYTGFRRGDASRPAVSPLMRIFLIVLSTVLLAVFVSALGVAVEIATVETGAPPHGVMDDPL